MVLFFDRQGLKVIGVGLMLGVSSYMHGEINGHIASRQIDGSAVVLDCDHPFSQSSQVSFLRVNSDTCVSFARLSNRVVVSSAKADFAHDVHSHWCDLWTLNALLGHESISRYQTESQTQTHLKFNQDIIASQPIKVISLGNSFFSNSGGNFFPYNQLYTSNTESRAGPSLF
jgi:hypothetical protein